MWEKNIFDHILNVFSAYYWLKRREIKNFFLEKSMLFWDFNRVVGDICAFPFFQSKWRNENKVGNRCFIKWNLRLLFPTISHNSRLKINIFLFLSRKTSKCHMSYIHKFGWWSRVGFSSFFAIRLTDTYSW